MESLKNDIFETYKYLPNPFNEFNESQGKMIYNEIMNTPYLPEGAKKRDKEPRFFRSILIYHLSNNTKELVSWINEYKSYLLRCGHLSKIDQQLIIEILFYHGFWKNNNHLSSLFPLYTLLIYFLNYNTDQLELSFNWKPIYNFIHALTLNKRVNQNMMIHQDDWGNIYNKLEILWYKLKKYFSESASKEIWDELLNAFNTDPYSEENDLNSSLEMGGYSQRVAKLVAFVFLIPIHPNNTTEEEIKSWLPILVKYWRENPFGNNLRHLFIGLLSEISIHFKSFDLSEYNELFSYHFYNTFWGWFTINNPKPFSKVFLPVSLARYIVWSYKPIKYQNKHGYENLNFEKLFKRFLDNLHPESGSANENFLRFLKFMSSSLWDRIKWERNLQKEIDNDQDVDWFLDKEDIKYFIEVFKPYIDLATQGQTALIFLSRMIKNLIVLDWDSILSMYIFQNFLDLSDLVSLKFLSLLYDIVVGVIVNTETESKYKYQFIQNVIEYLLEQTKLLDSVILKTVIGIFNIIWVSFPVLPADWGKNLIEKNNPEMDYSRYMKHIRNKNPQEYQFYRLYEKIYGYAVEYFDILKSAMNCDLSISGEIIKGFKFLLNAMPSEVFKPLILDLLENSNQKYSKRILGRIVNNIAWRSPETANKLLKFSIDHRLLEEDEETGEDTLASYKFDTNDYYISIVSSAAYRYKEGAKAYIK